MVNLNIKIIQLFEQISGLSCEQILECSANIKTAAPDTANDMQRYTEFRKLLHKLDLNRRENLPKG